MGIIYEKSEITLKVAGFTGANNTLYPPMTGASSSFTLFRGIFQCWIIIIIGSDPLTAKIHHVF